MDEVRAALHRLRSLPDAALDRLCRRHHVRVLTAFGSAAAEQPSPRDLDLGVVFEPDAEHDLLALLDDLAALLGTERIDLVDAQRASETARVRAIADGDALYESEPTAYADAAAAADALFLETAWMRRDAFGSVGR